MNDLSLQNRSAIQFSRFFVFCLTVNLILWLVVSAYAGSPMQVLSSTESQSTVCVPQITFTSKPPFGSEPPFISPTENRLYGRVDCLSNPAEYKIAVFIYVTGWWVKPSFANPLTPITPDNNTPQPDDGIWETIVYSCCLDHLAIKYAAFLFPNGYTPPTVGNLATLPQELFDNAAAYLIEDRLRTIEFSGYTWNVKESNGTQVGPGNNRFSSDANDVWVDGSGNLHLTLSKKNDNQWYSTEVFAQMPMSYGTYTFTTASPIDQLDKNAVLGFFTWDDSAPEYYFREIDVEFSKWGEDAGENSQYVVQPFYHPGNRHRFNTVLTEIYSTHSFKWEIDQIIFSSHQGHLPSIGDEIESWLYNGADVPPAGTVNARINLWLYNSLPPSDGQEIEVVVESFSYKTRFSDVPSDFWAFNYIERLANAGITGGCATDLYCPNNTVTRAQMAVFLLRGIHGSDYTPPPATGTMFTDVPASLSTAAWIEQLANEGITSGCGGGNYCPNNSVTRAQMAIFLLRAKYGSGYTPPPATGTMFGDVPASLSTAAWIEQLANEGITSGCSGGNYCPNNPVTRASMAVFLVRTFNLP